MKIFLFVALLGALSCAHGGTLTPRPRAAEQNVMIVDYVWPDVTTEPLNAFTWHNSPWHCGTLFTPAQVIVSGMHACILDTPVVDTPSHAEYFRCPHRWQSPSNAC